MTLASPRRTLPISKSSRCATAMQCTRGAGEAGAFLCERVTAPLQELRKCVAEKIRVFALAQVGQWIKPRQFGIDDAGMAHNHAAVGHAVKKIRKQFGVIGAGAERVGAGEGRVSA